MIFEYTFLYLSLCLLALLLIGIIFPHYVFLGKKSSRFKVIIIYGLGVTLALIAFRVAHNHKPKTESSFINAVNEIADKDGLQNINTEKQKQLCQYLEPGKVTDWIGTIDFSKNHYNGNLFLNIKINDGIIIKNWTQQEYNLNQLIPNRDKDMDEIDRWYAEKDNSIINPAKIIPGTPLYNKILKLSKFSNVRFSGSFIESDDKFCSNADGINQENPNSFLFKFDDISPVNYKLIK